MILILIQKIIVKQVTVEKIKFKSSPRNNGRTPKSKNKITLSKLSEQMTNLPKTVNNEFNAINHRINNLAMINNLKE